MAETGEKIRLHESEAAKLTLTIDFTCNRSFTISLLFRNTLDSSLLLNSPEIIAKIPFEDGRLVSEIIGYRL